ncbi:MAG: hypothetical protein GWN12_19025 [Thermoplasmata archaeon]|nr:hypothetical protein [Thermoplasmata archaeon]NIS14114.1 hypothetical protein [Thermoplasmata archaeon]NIW90812.1 hypothetical protein [Thermoplasmata archaeon]
MTMNSNASPVVPVPGVKSSSNDGAPVSMTSTVLAIVLFTFPEVSMHPKM